MLHTLFFLIGLLLVLATLLDGFETILLPRRVNHRFRYSRVYYRSLWRLWRRSSIVLTQGKWRESYLSIFGPLSLLGLFGSWIVSLMLGFAMMQWALGVLFNNGAGRSASHFSTYLYFSGTTYFTLGLGDVVPGSGWSRALTVVEAGLGFGFLAIIISYLPVLYQAFSKRELTISLMDARAGSPPSAGEFIRRLFVGQRIFVDDGTLAEWEQWCAGLLESHLSFPVLAFYRSQHANQSWLGSLTTMLDSCALLMALLPPEEAHRAQLTFAMARHAAVDISLIFQVQPQSQSPDRIGARVDQLRELISRAGKANELTDVEARLTEYRGMYEPFLDGMAVRFMLSLPPIIAAEPAADNWQRSAWMPRTPGIGKLVPDQANGDHFD